MKMIDYDTDVLKRNIVSKTNGRLLALAMSDEFNTDNRKFDRGSDKFFEALQKPDHTNEAIQFCRNCYFVLCVLIDVHYRHLIKSRQLK
jgi:hypothetical protein